MRLRLQASRYRVHDVDVTGEGEIRVPVDGENAISGVERAIRIRPGRVRIYCEAVGSAIAGANDAAGNRHLPTAWALLGDSEGGVDWEWRCDRCGTSRSALIDGHVERRAQSEIRSAEGRHVVHVGGQLIRIGLADVSIQSRGITTGSDSNDQRCATNQVEVFAH